MKFAAWFGIAVGLLMLGQWGFFLVSGNVPAMQTAPLQVAFHLGAEFVAAICMVLAGAGLLGALSWAPRLYTISSGMLIYTVINSPGYFAQRGDWGFVFIFAVLLLLTLYSLIGIARAGRPPAEETLTEPVAGEDATA